MGADDRQVTTVFTDQPSFHHRHLTNWVPWSVTIIGERWGEVWLHLRDDGNAWFVECRWWNDGWTVVTWRSSASMIPAPAYCSIVAAVWLNDTINFSSLPGLDVRDCCQHLPDLGSLMARIVFTAWRKKFWRKKIPAVVLTKKEDWNSIRC